MRQATLVTEYEATLKKHNILRPNPKTGEYERLLTFTDVSLPGNTSEFKIAVTDTAIYVLRMSSYVPSGMVLVDRFIYVALSYVIMGLSRDRLHFSYDKIVNKATRETKNISVCLVFDNTVTCNRVYDIVEDARFDFFVERNNVNSIPINNTISDIWASLWANSLFTSRFLLYTPVKHVRRNDEERVVLIASERTFRVCRENINSWVAAPDVTQQNALKRIHKRTADMDTSDPPFLTTLFKFYTKVKVGSNNDMFVHCCKNSCFTIV